MKIELRKIADLLGLTTEQEAAIRKGHMTLSAKIIAGPETAARLGVPEGTEIDLGEISRSEIEPIAVEASSG